MKTFPDESGVGGRGVLLDALNITEKLSKLGETFNFHSKFFGEPLETFHFFASLFGLGDVKELGGGGGGGGGLPGVIKLYLTNLSPPLKELRKCLYVFGHS